MVVTVKFQGHAIPWDALNAAINVTRKHGYKCHAKHFFNNKNEVTLMIIEEEEDTSELSEEQREVRYHWREGASFLGKPMVSTVLSALMSFSRNL